MGWRAYPTYADLFGCIHAYVTGMYMAVLDNDRIGSVAPCCIEGWPSVPMHAMWLCEVLM